LSNIAANVGQEEDNSRLYSAKSEVLSADQFNSPTYFDVDEEQFEQNIQKKKDEL